MHASRPLMAPYNNNRSRGGARGGGSSVGTVGDGASSTPYIAFCKRAPKQEWLLITGNHFAYIQDRAIPLPPVIPGTRYND